MTRWERRLGFLLGCPRVLDLILPKSAERHVLIRMDVGVHIGVQPSLCVLLCALSSSPFTPSISLWVLSMYFWNNECTALLFCFSSPKQSSHDRSITRLCPLCFLVGQPTCVPGAVGTLPSTRKCWISFFPPVLDLLLHPMQANPFYCCHDPLTAAFSFSYQSFLSLSLSSWDA